MRDEKLELALKSAKRIAIMGGTFDPIHYGHLVTAEAVLHEYQIDKVIFIPTGRPVFKNHKQVTHQEQRYMMTVLATMNHPSFYVSRIEIDRDTETYTIDTVRELRKVCGDETKIYFITGADAVQQILNWKDAEILLTLCSFIAVTRPGYDKESLYNHVQHLKNKFESRLHFLEVPSLAISSTNIRNRVSEGKPIKYLLPDDVERYIEKYSLYNVRSQGDEVFEPMKSQVKKTISKERFQHTMGVVKEAEKLAERYKVDRDSAKIAAVLHDYARCMSDDEIKKYCKDKGLKLDSFMKKRPMLAHAMVGAEKAKEEFMIHDENIRNAICYHTTGRASMTRLEKIIFLADMIEQGRDSFNGLQEIRVLAYENLDEAVMYALRSTIAYNSKQGKAIHPDSLEALAFLEKEKEYE